MNKENKLPLLIDFDSNGFEEFKKSVFKARGIVNDFFAKFNDLIEMEITDDQFKDLIDRDGEVIADKIRDKMDNAQGIPSKIARKEMGKNLIEKYYQLRADFKSLLSMKIDSWSDRRISTSSAIKCIQIENGQAVILDGEVEKNRVEYQRLIRTEAGLKVYEAQQKFVEAVNNFIDLDVNGYYNLSSIKGIGFSKYPDRRVKVSNSLNYDGIALKKNPDTEESVI